MSIGLDVGTAFCVCARKDQEGKLKFKKERTSFFQIEQGDFTKGLLDNNKVNYIQKGKELFILGDEALKFANLFHKEAQRPLAQGMLSPREKESVPMLRLLLEELVGEPTVEKEVVYYSIPANPVDAVKNNIYHEKVIEEILKNKGYTPKSMNEAMAIVYSELANNKFSGIAMSFGAGMCLSGDTKVPLLNGEVKTMWELTEYYKDKEFWVYSCKEDGSIVPGLASNPHKVKTAEVIRLWLDNGKYLDCTPDHKIMTRNGQYKEAQDLAENESIMPLYLFDNEIDGRVGYKQVIDNKTGRKNSVHRLIFKRFNNCDLEKSDIIHHKDYNSANNNPLNLQKTNRAEHQVIHNRLAILNKANKGKTYEEIYGWEKALYHKAIKSLAHHNSSKNKGRFGQKPTWNKGLKGENYLNHFKDGIHNQYTNHKITKIEKLGRQVEVYDFTVKDYHNFAIDAGIFVHNCNVALAYLSVPILTFATTKGGDWIDEISAQSQGETSSKMQEKKEKELDLSIVQDDILLKSLAIHYDALIDYTLKHFVAEFKKSKNLPETGGEKLPIVVSGGTSMPKGFLERFKARLALMEMPIPIGNVIKASDPLNAVAKGLLIKGLAEVDPTQL